MEDSPQLPDGVRSVTGFERFAIWSTAGAFQIGDEGEPYFYFLRRDRAFVLPGLAEWRRLRILVVVLMSGVALATVTSTAGHQVLSALKLLTIPLFVLIPWIYSIRLPRVSRRASANRAKDVRSAVMNRRLALELLEAGTGWAIFTGALVPFERDTTTAVLAIVGGSMLADGMRRLLRRQPLPDGIY